MSPAPTVDACTIVSCNYLPFARVLARSFREQHPGGRFYTILLDRLDDRFDPDDEPFELIEIGDVPEVPHLRSFLFRYTILEANTAVKPFVLRHLFATRDIERLLYLDPDILVTGPLEPLTALVDEHSVVVTPHLTDPIDDGLYPGEQAILQAGSYNLGFVGLRRDETSDALLRWWGDRLREKCVVRIEDGLFVDQKWMDLAPGLFGDVHVLRDPGYNVAYWNLHGREVKRSGEGWASNGRPLVFFHFSGIQPESLEQVSKHQTRFRLGDIGEAADLYRHYASLLLAAGWHETRGWSYAFGTFDNGVAIPDAARRLYLDLGPDRDRFGDPFVTGAPVDDPSAAHSASFFAWLQEPAPGRPKLSRLLASLLETRPDLQAAYPDPGGRDRADFAGWLDAFGRHELRLDPVFLRCFEGVDRPSLLSVAAWNRRLQNRAKRLWHSPTGRKVRDGARGALGPERAARLRQRLRPAPPANGSGESRDAAHPWAGRFRPPVAIERPGVNLLGYLDAETGMGQGARALARALESAGIPLSLQNLGLHVLARREDRSFGAPESDFPYDVNLLFVNADQVEPVVEHLGTGAFAGRYNVGYWLWELDRFPTAQWPAAFAPFHEVWTASTFCLDALSAVAPVPVRRVPLPVPDPGSSRHDRAHFDLPDDAFVVFFMFNYLSWFERKNPLAAVEAFRRAFADDPGAVLYLKTSQGESVPGARDRVRAAVADLGNVRLVEEYLDRDEIDSLTDLCDVYVSLHRSEGFGLTVAEAMVRSRPVVATDYSGTTDFVDGTVGRPIAWSPVGLDADAGPYPAGAVWAEPDTEAAAAALRELREDPATAARLGRAARQRVLDRLGVETIGGTVRDLFDRIVTATNRGTLRPPR